MIPLIVFYIHIVAAVAIFTKRWQEANTLEAFLAIGFMGLIFGVGWSVSTFILKIFIEKEGFASWFDRDAMSLLLLTAIEVIFYYSYIKWEKQKKTIKKINRKRLD